MADVDAGAASLHPLNVYALGVADLDDITGAWDYGELPGNVVVGEGVWLERRDSFGRFRSTREPGLVLGDGVRVHTWTSFNVDPGGLVEVGDDTLLVGPVFMCSEHIRIGSGCVISYHVTIADSDFHPIDPEPRRADTEANAVGGDKSKRPAIVSRPVVIGDRVRIGIGAIVLKGVTIGDDAVVGPGAVVTHDVRPGVHVLGNPAEVVTP
jgi:acetyltransferase-like isoleucine patch superfamily enzyme